MSDLPHMTATEVANAMQRIELERQATFAAMAQLFIDECDEHRKVMRKLSGLDKPGLTSSSRNAR